MNSTAIPRRAVFLDRDGVINRALVREGKPYPPVSAQEMELAPDAKVALNALRDRGYLLVVVTNQPDISRGKQKRETVDEMHQFLIKELPLQAVYVCPHDDSDRCICRKPRPGLLLQAAQDLGLNLAQCFLIGDRWRDIEATHNAGCPGVFIDYHYQERQPDSPEYTADSLSAAVVWILTQHANTAGVF